MYTRDLEALLDEREDEGFCSRLVSELNGDLPIETTHADAQTKLDFKAIAQYYVKLLEKEKDKKLRDILHALDFNQLVVYVNSNNKAMDLEELCVKWLFPTTCVFSTLSETEVIRRTQMFEEGLSRILVATHTQQLNERRVNVIVNYDIPISSQLFIENFQTLDKAVVISFQSSAGDLHILNDVRERGVEIKALPCEIDSSEYMLHHTHRKVDQPIETHVDAHAKLDFNGIVIETHADAQTKLDFKAIVQYYVKLLEKEKDQKLRDILHALDFNQLVVYVNSNKKAMDLEELCVKWLFPTTCVFSTLSETEVIRRTQMFEEGLSRILVATHTQQLNERRVNVIVNYDIPISSQLFIENFQTLDKAVVISFQSSAGDLQILSDVREMGVEIKALPCEIDSSEYMLHHTRRKEKDLQ